MSGQQAMVLVLLVAAFAAGWVARDVPFARRRRELPRDPLQEAATWLERCVAAGMDQEGLAGALAELDRLDPEVERAAGSDGPAYVAFDRALNQAHFLRRSLAAEGGRPVPATLAATDELARAAREYRQAVSVELST